jgi:hypothetical protein
MNNNNIHISTYTTTPHSGRYHPYYSPRMITKITEYWYNVEGSHYRDLHREDGPAVVWGTGDLEWWQYSNRHRLDGPACLWANGTKEWWINGKRLDVSTDEEFERLIKMKVFW